MNLVGLTVAYMKDRVLGTVLNLMLMALGVGTIVVLILFGGQFNDRMTGDARGIDLVVGAKGSPMQLILSALYQADIPTGNIPLEEVDKLRKNRFVKKAIPLAMGDSFQRFRIVGTEESYAEHFGVQLAAGRLWRPKTMEATIGSAVAAATGIKVGQTFAGSHGLGGDGHGHMDHPYTVVGILKPTGRVIDRLVLTSIEAVWNVHGDPAVEEGHGHDEHAGHEEHEEHAGHDDHAKPADDHDHDRERAAPVIEKPKNREVTSVLIAYTSPIAAATMPRAINRETALQAASPAFELARLFALVGVGVDTLRGFGFLLIGVAALSVFIALYNAMQERRYDLAIMRSLGAPRAKLFGQVLLEGLLMAGTGTVLGLLFGHGVTHLLGQTVTEARAMGLTGLDWRPAEVYILALGLGVGVLAAIVPALQAFKVDIAKTLMSK